MLDSVQVKLVSLGTEQIKMVEQTNLFTVAIQLSSWDAEWCYLCYLGCRVYWRRRHLRTIEIGWSKQFAEKQLNWIGEMSTMPVLWRHGLAIYCRNCSEIACFDLTESRRYWRCGIPVRFKTIIQSVHYMDLGIATSLFNVMYVGPNAESLD